MTQQASLAPEAGRRYRFNPLRVLFCGVLLTALVAICLYLYHTSLAFLHARVLDNGSKTFGWLLKQFNFSLPFIVICIFHYAVYHKHDRRDGVACREMLWEIILVAILTYGVLLPYLSDISEALHTNAVALGLDIPRTEGKHDETLIMGFHEWFIRLAVPLVALGIFYATRARRERLFPETEVSEPLMTRAEYDALQAREHAASAADGTTAEETNGAVPETRDECPRETTENGEVTVHE
jgi:hypothetical protein